MSCHTDNQTIIAQCTPKGSGALALLRICGKNALTIADNLAQLANKKPLSAVPSHTIHYGSIKYEGNTIDQVLFFVMRAPKTFTGQDTVEISCHNNQYIIQGIIASAIKFGARIAQPGEFTKRAVTNKKIDLLQAEAINELIHAGSHQALRLSLAQLKGSLSHHIGTIETTLIKALALAEVSFEFVEDDLEVRFYHEIHKHIEDVYKAIQGLLHQFSQQKQIRDGIKIVFIGTVNAGKSSLFNALVGTERAIVTNTPGTTRDTIESGLYVKGRHWTLADTAGLRNTTDIIEQKGIERSHDQAHEADIILLVFDTSTQQSPQEKHVYNLLITQYQKKIISVFNKHDISGQSAPSSTKIDSIAVSAKTEFQIDLLRSTIEGKINELMEKNDSPFLLNQRHVHILSAALYEIEKIRKYITDNMGCELLAVHIRDTIERFSEITGQNVTEKALDTVFKEFCIGK